MWSVVQLLYDITIRNLEFNVKPKEIKPGAPGKDIGIRVYTDILII